MSTNTIMFPGSGDVYVQFHDILGTPMFDVLRKIIYGELVPGLYDTGFLGRIPIEQQIQWYLLRPKFNFLQIPEINIHHLTDDENDRMMQQLLEKVSYDTFSPVDLISSFMLHPIVDHLHVYSRFNEPRITLIANRAIRSVQSVEYQYGLFQEIIRPATDHASLITTSTQEAKTFLDSKYKNRYVTLIFPNGYDSIRNLSDIYSQYANQINVIDLRARVQVWKETVQ